MADCREQRAAVKFCFLLGKSAAETIVMLKTAYGDAALSKTRVYEWFSRFKNGEISIEDQPRSGRPATSSSDENVDKINVLVEWRPSSNHWSTLWDEWNILEFNSEDFSRRFAHGKSCSQICPSQANKGSERAGPHSPHSSLRNAVFDQKWHDTNSPPPLLTGPGPLWFLFVPQIEKGHERKPFCH